MPNASAPSHPRRLLNRIQTIMRRPGSADAHLRQVVREIAKTLGADVCSCYFRRAGDLLELFATHGLKRTAVHRTRLRIGEGLVGAVAASGEPLVIADAPTHPRFALRPETGEERLHAFVGVPLLRSGRTAGVLVIQSVDARTYAATDVETLQTVAAVLADLAAVVRLVDPAELAEASGNVTLPRRFQGAPLATGVGLGQVIHHGPTAILEAPVSDDPDRERERLRTAIAALTVDLDTMAATVESRGGRFEREILDAFRLFVESSGWIRRMYGHVDAGLTADGAVMRVQEDTRARMLHVPDAYLRERLADFDDLANRLRSLLAGGDAHATYPDDIVVVAREIGPAALLEYDIKRIRGLVLESGSPSTHVSILARSLGIPVVGQIREATLHLEEASLLALNGDTGEVFVDPAEDILERFRALLRAGSAAAEWHERTRSVPAVTLDGVEVALLINGGFAADADQVESTGAEGVGLFRTELPFLLHRTHLDEERQETLYRDVLERARGRPVTFRTLDLGGDKRIDSMETYRQGGRNPALGWRGIRSAFDRPQLLKEQLRALLRAHAGRPLRVMFPMVANASDLDRALDLLERVLAVHASDGGTPPERLAVGVMVEIPALLWQSDLVLRKVDFVAVGTNDLTAFLYARDRANPELAERYPFLSGPPLSSLHALVQSAHDHDVELSVCGEVADQPLTALALVGIGVRRLSMSPASVGTVKAAIRSFRASQAAPYLQHLMRHAPGSFRPQFQNFVRDHGVRI